MKNPLIKRLPKELKSELGKYLVLFVFMTAVIGFISGFLVASGSLKAAYDEGFEKYQIHDGRFELAEEADAALIETLEKDGVTIYEDHYIEKETDRIDSTLRIYKGRQEIDKVCLMEGSLPETAGQIAIDRMYADNNKISVGDTLGVGGVPFTVTGLVAFSDYSSLFASPADMMFDALKFGVALVTEDGFESLGKSGLHYNYSWMYDTAPKDDAQAKEMGDRFLETLTKHAALTNYVPQYSDPAIQFTDEDMGNDRFMFTMFLYIVVAIIAFIFAITTSNTITKEATVIGTLRASGYTKGEVIRHYLSMPMLVIAVSALVGNILGYTVFKNVAVDIYYTNYSLPTFVTKWSPDAFLKTTVIPVVIMFVINLGILVSKLSLSPLQFIRRNLSKKGKKKSVKLSGKLSIMKRFRLRIVFQNLPNYIAIAVGILFANVILLLGMAMPAMLENAQEDISKSMFSNYQYVLKAPVDTQTDGAERYCAGNLKTPEGRIKSENVSLYGIVPDSRYVNLKLEGDAVYISSAYAEKYDVSVGETVELEDEFTGKEYSFRVDGVYDYTAAIAVFMSQEQFNETFGNEAGWFNGYFSNGEIKDIDEMLIANKITEDDYNKMSRQLTTSLGGIFDLFFWFGLVMFVLIIYLLSKIIIEKNAQSISMTKILGYSNGEISGLYILTTSIVVIASLILTLPVVHLIMGFVCETMLSQFPGWMPYYVPFSAFVKIAAAGIGTYAVVAWFQFRKVKKISLALALKNVE